MTLYVGTSGYAYREWKPAFYPADLPQRRFLEHYARALGACEVNATFYRLQSDETLRGWAAAVPDDFRFAAKAHRRLTHARAWPRAGDDFLAAFVRSLSNLGDKLGVVLWQFPPYRARDDDALAGLTGALPPGLPCAFEFRNDSWRGVEDTLARAGHAVCVSETGGRVPDALPPGPRAYVRLRAERYGARERDGWLELLTSEARARDVYVFAKHEGIPAGDPYGGVGLAAWLHEQTRAPD